MSVDRVVDGDTLDVTIDVGFRLHTQQRIRVLGVDTPERGEEGWAEAGQHVRAWCAEKEGRMRIATAKSDSFGRYLGDLYDADTMENLTSKMLSLGYSIWARPER